MNNKVTEVSKQQEIDHLIDLNNERSNDFLIMFREFSDYIAAKINRLTQVSELDLAGIMLLSEYELIYTKLDKLLDKFNNYDDTESVIIGKLLCLLQDNNVQLISNLKEIIDNEEKE